MAGFETVVRPVIFPSIRPTARQSLPPEDDPEKGFAVIRGNPAEVVNLTYSYSISYSHSNPVEIERDVDDLRVYQKDDGGLGKGNPAPHAFAVATPAAAATINRDNYVDLQVARRIYMDAGPKGKQTWAFNEVKGSDNVVVRKRNTRVS